MKTIIFLILFLNISNVYTQTIPNQYESILNDLAEMPYIDKITHLDNVFKKQKNDPWYYWMKAGVYELMEDSTNTRLCYEKSITIDPKFAAGYGSYGRYLLYSDSSSYAKAITLSSKAIELDSSEYYYYIDRAETYLKLNKIDEAISDALYYNSHVSEFYSTTGSVILFHCYRKIKYDEKIKEILDLINLTNNMIEMDDLLLFADYYNSYGQKNKACTCYQSAAEQFELIGDEVPAKLLNLLKKCN